MLLAVNIGNTHIRMGLFSDGTLQRTWRLRTDPHRTEDEYIHLLNGMFKNAEISDGSTGTNPGITKSIFATVVPPLREVFRRTLVEIAHSEPIIVNTKLDTGISIKTDSPDELGSDLLVNGAAAYHLYGRDCIVVDFGTALSFTIITSDGELLGATIAPGVSGALESLVQDTAQLHQVELTSSPPSAVGKNTTQAIQSGLLYGYSGLVKGILDQIKAESNRNFFVIATGGLSTIFGSMIESIQKIDPFHTLRGLHILYGRNTS